MWITPHNTVSSRPVWLLTTQVAKGRHHRRSLHIYWHFMSPRNDIIMGSISAPNRRQSLWSTYYYYLNLEPSNNYIGTALDNKNWFTKIINQCSPFKNHDQRGGFSLDAYSEKSLLLSAKKLQGHIYSCTACHLQRLHGYTNGCGVVCQSLQINGDTINCLRISWKSESLFAGSIFLVSLTK